MGNTLPLQEWIKELYLNLLKDGWKLNEIDEMDIGWYFELINYTDEKEYVTQSNALDDAGL